MAPMYRHAITNLIASRYKNVVALIFFNPVNFIWLIGNNPVDPVNSPSAAAAIDHIHYDVIRARPDGSCNRPAETGPSVLSNRRESHRDEHDKSNVSRGKSRRKLSLAPR